MMIIKEYLINSFLRLIFTMFFIVMGATESWAAEDIPSVWGELQPGSYNVGFRTIFTYDRSKPPVPYADWDGKIYPTAETVGRQMQLNIWYPARVSNKDIKLYFRHYVELMSRQTEFSPLDDDKKGFADEQFIAKIKALGGSSFTTANQISSKVWRRRRFSTRNLSTGNFH